MQVEHKKTLFYMEQLILKYNAHKDALNIKLVHEGIDFYFAKKDEARKLVQFFQVISLWEKKNPIQVHA